MLSPGEYVRRSPHTAARITVSVRECSSMGAPQSTMTAESGDRAERSALCLLSANCSVMRRHCPAAAAAVVGGGIPVAVVTEVEPHKSRAGPGILGLAIPSSFSLRENFPSSPRPPTHFRNSSFLRWGTWAQTGVYCSHSVMWLPSKFGCISSGEKWSSPVTTPRRLKPCKHV